MGRVRIAVAAVLLAAAVIVVVVATGSKSPAAEVVVPTFKTARLVSDGGVAAPVRDRGLVNGWGLIATSSGPWWTTNEATDVSTLYSGDGKKQLLTVSVPGGPTGIVFNAGHGFRVSGGGRSDPARFIYACEDGKIRAWTPTVPGGWSTKAVVAYDGAGEASIFRGVALAGGRLYATDFHNDRIDVFDSRWRKVQLPAGAFADNTIPAWYAPDNIQAFGGHLFVTYVFRAPVDGNDSPAGGFVDEFDRNGVLVARVARMGRLMEPWGLALAPASFGRYGGDLLVANFGNGHINAYRRLSGRWTWDGALAGPNGRALSVNGVWGIGFGNGGAAGPRNRLFFMSGPHKWIGATEVGVHGLFGSITPLSS